MAGFAVEYVTDLPLPAVLELAEEVQRAKYAEKFENTWAIYVAAQGDGKNMKELTKKFKKIAEA